jgi:hypothetical protein
VLDPADEERFARSALTLFAALWALAELFETLPALWPLRPLAELGLELQLRGLSALAALWLLLRPSSTPRLALLALAAAAHVWRRMPISANHGFLTLTTNLTLLLVLAAWLVRRDRARPAHVALLRGWAPAIRLSLLVMYGWATFHKLNADYLDPALSCAGIELHKVDSRLGLIPTGPAAVIAAIYGTLVIEAAIPLLLALRRTRALGVALALLFHLVLGLSYPAFSAVLYAYMALFLAPGALARARDLAPVAAIGRLLSSRGFTLIRRGLEAAFLTGAALLVLWVRLTGLGLGGDRAARDAGRHFVWLALGSLLAAGFLLLLAKGRGAPALGGALRPRPAILWLAPALVLANGLTPYLGLKTAGAFAMFSNLRVDGGVYNHLLVPASVQVFHQVDDLVQVKASNDPDLKELAYPRRSPGAVRLGAALEIADWSRLRSQDLPTWKIPHRTLCAHVKKLKDAGRERVFIRYQRGGKEVTTSRAETEPELAPPGYLWRKLFLLRPVADTPRGICQW